MIRKYGEEEEDLGKDNAADLVALVGTKRVVETLEEMVLESVAVEDGVLILVLSCSWEPSWAQGGPRSAPGTRGSGGHLILIPLGLTCKNEVDPGRNESALALVVLGCWETLWTETRRTVSTSGLSSNEKSLDAVGAALF